MAKVSAIIPCYNYAEYVRDAIDSVVNQLLNGDELIVIDDGSTDDTRACLDEYIQSGVIQYHYQDNAGVSAARNYGARVASGDYLYFLDADDRVLPEGLDKLREHAGQHPDCSMVFAGHSTIDDNGKQRIHLQQTIGEDRQQNFIDYAINKRFSIANGGCVLIQRSVALEYPYPETIRVSEDFCVYAWILVNQHCCSIPDPVVEIRKHRGSLREQVKLYEEAVELLPDVVFDQARLPQALLKYKDRFFCNRMLSLFRAQYLAGRIDESRISYRKAIRCNPVNIFKASYLRKYLRTFF